MGSLASHDKTCYVYARDRATDKYLDAPILTVDPVPMAGHKNSSWRRSSEVNTDDDVSSSPLISPTLQRAMGIFKREVYAMATEYDHTDIKALYLYSGRWRVARAERVNATTLHVRFASDETRNMYTAARERMAHEGRWPLCGPSFTRRFTRRTAATEEEPENVLLLVYDDDHPHAEASSSG